MNNCTIHLNAVISDGSEKTVAAATPEGETYSAHKQRRREVSSDVVCSLKNGLS